MFTDVDRSEQQSSVLLGRRGENFRNDNSSRQTANQTPFGGNLSMEVVTHNSEGVNNRLGDGILIEDYGNSIRTDGRHAGPGVTNDQLQSGDTSSTRPGDGSGNEEAKTENKLRKERKREEYRAGSNQAVIGTGKDNPEVLYPGRGNREDKPEVLYPVSGNLVERIFLFPPET
jgi:hypothetical protein